jgi:predicted acetyltransferase
MNDASARMKAKGILIAYLVGISGFYNRFGYYPFMARSSVKFFREPAETELRPGRLRAMTRKDLPSVRRLYDEVTARRICAAVRDDKVWDWLLRPGGHTWIFRVPKVILDARGRLCGYLTMEPKGELNIREIIVRQEEESCRVALGAMVREARRREVKEITLPLPWDDALTVFLRQYVRAEFTMASDATGGALMKIVDFPALMRRLEPLFAQRWKRAGKGLPAAKFTLSSEIGSVGLTVTRGSVRVGDPAGGPRVRIPQRWLSGMITGYYPLSEVAPRPGAVVPSRLMPVLDVLFPSGWPFVYQGDNM